MGNGGGGGEGESGDEECSTAPGVDVFVGILLADDQEDKEAGVKLADGGGVLCVKMGFGEPLDKGLETYGLGTDAPITVRLDGDKDGDSGFSKSIFSNFKSLGGGNFTGILESGCCEGVVAA